MSVGGKSGNQSSSSSGTMSGSSITDQLGVTNSSGTQTGQTTANPTDAWSQISGALQGNLGSSGLSPIQQQALGYYTNPNAAYGTNDFFNKMGSTGQALHDFSTSPANLAAPTSMVSTGQVTAPTAASFMSLYDNPYQSQVIDAAKADAGQSLATGLNQIAANFGGQYGNTGAGVAAGQAVGDYTRALNSTLAGLRSTGFTTAAGLGAGDAANALSASGQNAANALQASTTNAANTQQNNMFNAGQQDAATNRAINGVNSWMGTLGNEAQMANNNAQSMYSMGGGGVNQLLAYLQSQVPAFGQSTTGSQTSSGVSANTGQTNTTGQYSNQSSGSSSSKGGSGDLSDIGKLAALCWVARAVYGPENPQWMVFRAWLLTKAPKWLLRLYLRRGESFAKWITDKPRLRRAIRNLMDRVTR